MLPVTRTLRLCTLLVRPRVIAWTRVERLVFVCKGNICRSPYAEGLAKSLGVASVSFGLDTTPGLPANDSALATAKARGIDLRAHRTRKFDATRVEASDLLVFMEPWQYLRAPFDMSSALPQASLLGLWAKPSKFAIADPYGQPQTAFVACFDQIDTAVAELRRRYRESHAN